MAKGTRDVALGTFNADAATRSAKRSGGGGGGGDDEHARAVILHERITAARRRKGMTEEELCAEAGIKFERLRNIARGGSKNPSFFAIIDVAAALGVSPFWLAGLTDDPGDMGPVARKPKRSKK